LKVMAHLIPLIACYLANITGAQKSLLGWQEDLLGTISLNPRLVSQFSANGRLIDS